MNIIETIERVKLSAEGSRAERTANTYIYGWDAFTSFLHHRKIEKSDPVEKITIEEFIDFPEWLAAKRYSKQTMGVYMAAARFLLNWLVIKSYILPDYHQSLRFEAAIEQVFKRREFKLVRFPPRGVAEKVKDAVYQLPYPSPVRDRNIALVEFLYCTGCRNNEAASLNVRDVDFSENSAKVNGKGNKERKVFFGERAAQAIRDYWKARGNAEKSSPAFARHDKGAGKKIVKRITNVTVRNIVDDCALMAGLEKGSFTPHYFRHAFAIKVLSETHNLAIVQDLLGHATPNSTRVYAKIYPDELRDIHHQIYE